MKLGVTLMSHYVFPMYSEGKRTSSWVVGVHLVAITPCAGASLNPLRLESPDVVDPGCDMNKWASPPVAPPTAWRWCVRRASWVMAFSRVELG